MWPDLNKVIDCNYYPVEEARRSNMRHRPIGLGVQGLADAVMIMRYPFESGPARALNADIFETIYFGKLRQVTVPQRGIAGRLQGPGLRGRGDRGRGLGVLNARAGSDLLCRGCLGDPCTARRYSCRLGAWGADIFRRTFVEFMLRWRTARWPK